MIRTAVGRTDIRGQKSRHSRCSIPESERSKYEIGLGKDENYVNDHSKNIADAVVIFLHFRCTENRGVGIPYSGYILVAKSIFEKNGNS